MKIKTPKMADHKAKQKEMKSADRKEQLCALHLPFLVTEQPVKRKRVRAVYVR